MPLFSVIIATRNRPALFGQALASVIGQSCDTIEIIVINDGSEKAHLPEYHRLIDRVRRPIQLHSLVHRTRGHGPGYVRNFGVDMASGQYVCFLDDDDVWTDVDYLSRVQETLGQSDTVVDLHFSNQVAVLLDKELPPPIWIEDLADMLAELIACPDQQGTYRVTVDQLLQTDRFCHLNTTVVRRDIFVKVGGFDESIRWEQDRDLYLRLIDCADFMFYSPRFVSRHTVPDPTKKLNSTTSLSELERRLQQLRVFDKAILFASHPAIQALGRRQKGYTLKHIAVILAARNHHRAAAYYAREALGAGPTLKWAGYTALRLLASAKKERNA